jgi:UPF0042 nucleotide-binding protein
VKEITTFIITGLSGSGKSTAMAALEDAGFYCVDNMPVDLLPKFLDLPMERDSEITGIALVMDLRGKGFIAKYDSVFNELQQKGYYFEILFLEAEEEILVQRYSTTRRQHPLSSEKSLLDGIRAEKKQLAPKEVKNWSRYALMFSLLVSSTGYLMMLISSWMSDFW